MRSGIWPVSPALLILLALFSLPLSGCGESMADLAGPHEEAHAAAHAAEHAPHKIVVTSAVEQDVVSTQEYVCQIHSRRHIEVCALEGGYLEEIHMREGQAVQQGDLLFKILPVLHTARLNSELAEAQLARLKVQNTQQLVSDNVVSKRELALAQAELDKAEANVALAQAELSFTGINAPFDGIVDRQLEQQGSLIEEGDVLTTLSDNSVMWVYFNVPEDRYLEYITEQTIEVDGDDDDHDDDQREDRGDEGTDVRIELELANGQTLAQPGTIGAIEADFNNETGNISFRADFPNPEGLLRHGQTGTVLLHRDLEDAIVIPQRATYEILAKQYVYVIDDDDVVHQREIVVQKELEDLFVIQQGLEAGERIIFEGIRQVRDGDTVEYEFRDPAEILAHLKNHAE